MPFAFAFSLIIKIVICIDLPYTLFCCKLSFLCPSCKSDKCDNFCVIFTKFACGFAELAFRWNPKIARSRQKRLRY